MKKAVTILLAAIMTMVCAVPAFAETADVTYHVDPSYTVSIPASVTLGDSAVTADITASNVIIETGTKIVVKLTEASNTASGTTFNAKNGESVVNYTITADEAVAVGDTVATFTADGTQALTFSAGDESNVKVAGNHTETLTFGISLEDVGTKIVWNSADGFNGITSPQTRDGVSVSAGTIFRDGSLMNGGTFTTDFGNFTKIEVTGGNVTLSGEGWTTVSDKTIWTGNASSVTFSGNALNYPQTLVIVFTIEE